MHGRGPQSHWPNVPGLRRLARRAVAPLGVLLPMPLRKHDCVKRRRHPVVRHLRGLLVPDSQTDASQPTMFESTTLDSCQRAVVAVTAFAVFRQHVRWMTRRNLKQWWKRPHPPKRLGDGFASLILERERCVLRNLARWQKHGLLSDHTGDLKVALRSSLGRNRSPRFDCLTQVTVEHVSHVPGLSIVRGLFSNTTQQQLVANVDSLVLGTTEGSVPNQAMAFGDIPRWCKLVVDSCCRVKGFLPASVLARKPLFDQLIANVYYPSQGITRHVDLLKFDDGVLGVSLCGSAILSFRHLKDGVILTSGNECKLKDSDLCDDVFNLHVHAGDVYLLSGDARFRWTHEIDASSLRGARRLSLTLRRLLPSSWSGPG